MRHHGAVSAPDGTDIDRSDPAGRAWVDRAVAAVEADAHRSADTHLLTYPLPPEWGVDLYLKDESTHPTGSLKHRLARSLFLYGLCSGQITEGTTVVEASSGSTAVSEAWFARMLGLPFIAVMPASTSAEKVALIEFHGGRCTFVQRASDMYEEARRMAAECGGTTSTSSPSPSGPPTGAATTTSPSRCSSRWRWSATPCRSGWWSARAPAARAPRSAATCATGGYRTRLAVVDPENSAFFPGYAAGDPDRTTGTASRIEGIGRPRVEPSFVPTIVDRMIRVPDAASLAAMRHLAEATGRRAGGSTGTNLWGAFSLVAEMLAAGVQGSVVTLLCDGGERYAHTYHSDDWVAAQGLDLAPHTATLRRFAETGEWRPVG